MQRSCQDLCRSLSTYLNTIRLVQAFPPPPLYYKDFAPHKDSGDEHMLPAPPPPVQGEYQLFGELHTVSCRPALCIQIWALHIASTFWSDR